MDSYTVQHGQNLFDVAILLYGSVEGIFDLLVSNPAISMDTELVGGETLNYHSYFEINTSIVSSINENGIIPANGERHVYFKKTSEAAKIMFGVESSVSSVSFEAQGDGTMYIDWGDNSDLEKVTLNSSVRAIEHYFDNQVESRRIIVYGTFSFEYLCTTNIPGNMLLLEPVTVDEYVSQANGFSLDGLLLFEGTYKVDLQRCDISDLIPISDMSLQELNLLDAKFSSVGVIDDYLVHIVNNYGTRRNCTVYLNTAPSSVGMAAINTIINEADWNASGKWVFVINGTTYTKS
jgi:hypothetical protein